MSTGPNLQTLAAWIAENMPALDTVLRDQPDMSACLRVLNNATGLDIAAGQPVETTAPQFLAALQQIHNSKGNHEKK